MPQVHNYTAVPDVSPQNIPSPSFRIDTPPAAFGVNVGQAIQHLGTTAEQVGGELWNRAIAIQQLRNETEATQAAAAYDGQADKTFVDFENTKRGLNAVNGEADHRKAQQDLWQNTRDSLSNPMAQRLFDGKSLSTLRSVMFSGARHAAAEGRQAYGNSLQAEAQTAADTARNAKTEEEFQQKLDGIDSTVRNLQDLTGQSPEWGGQLAFKYKSSAIANRIEQIARTDPVAARKLLDQAIEAGSLHGNDRDRIESRVHSNLMTVGARTFTEQNEKDFRDPESFLAARAAGKNVHAQGVDQQFGQNLVAAITAYESATGKKASIESLARSYQEQARIHAEHEALPGGVEAHPAAVPGTSRHEFGQAADVDSGFANWLREGDNARKYGLEFLSGRTGVSDPNHIQLAGGAPLRQVKSYDINERDYVNGAEAKLRANIPNPTPELVDRVRSDAQALYGRNATYDLQKERFNRDTILEAFDHDNPPRTLQELLTLDPKYQTAWDQLDQKDQDVFVRRLRQQGITTDNVEWQRLRGMSQSQDEDERQKFLHEDILSNNKLSPGSQREIMKLQDTVRKQAFIEPRVAHAENELLDAGIITDDDRKDKVLMARLRGTLWDRIDQYQKVREAYPKPEEIRQMGSRIMAEMPSDVKYTHDFTPGVGFATLRNFFNRPGRLIDVTVPTQASDEIISQWSSSHGGIPPTDEQVKRIYIGQQLNELYPVSKAK